MIREEVLKSWGEIKDKVEELAFENFAYRGSFVISGQIEPEKHHKNRMIKGLGIPDRMVTNTKDAKTGLSKEVNSDISYNLNGRTFSYSSVVILLWGAPTEIVD